MGLCRITARVPGSAGTMPDTSIPMACRYRLDEQVGAGGFGQVWRGTDVTLGRTVAIKLLRPACAQDLATLARFRAEARHAAALCHPNIAAIHDFCDPPPPGTPFLVMEYVAGPSLATLLADGPIGPAPAMHVLADVAAGLAAAHQAGLVHRDIKPSNLLLDRDGRVKITDFGISHATGSAPLTATGVLMGTPAYMAPERVVGAMGSAVSDIYSLGVVAYHAVTGAVPFSGSPLDVAMAHRERPMPQLPESVPREIAAFITQLTAKDPAARPADANEVARRAGRLCEQLTAGPAHVARRPGMYRRHGAAPYPYPTRKLRDRAGPARFYRHAAVAAAAVMVTLVGVHLAGARSTATPYAAAMPRLPIIAQSSPPHVAAAQTVEVTTSTLVGEQVAVAARQLRTLGLPVLVVWQPTERETPGTVLSVRPGGRVTVGRQIELDAACGPASVERAAPPAHHNHLQDAGPEKGPPRKDHRPHDGDAAGLQRIPEREVAGGAQPVSRERAQRRFLLSAQPLRPGTPGTEPTAGRRVEYGRQFPAYPGVLPGALGLRIGHRHGIHELPRYITPIVAARQRATDRSCEMNR